MPNHSATPAARSTCSSEARPRRRGPAATWAAIALAVGAALGACTDRPTATPTVPASASPSAASATGTAAARSGGVSPAPGGTPAARAAQRATRSAILARPGGAPTAVPVMLAVGGGAGDYSPGLLPARYGNGGAAAELVSQYPSLPGTGRAAQASPTETAPAEGASDERYRSIWDNPFLAAAEAPLSTFAIDVDTASFSNVRRFLGAGERPPLDAVRIEELVNYFPYDDPLPEPGGEPLRVNLELTDAPWRPGHRLLRVNLTSRPIAFDGRPLSNLVFLVDVSGSMQDASKLPLVRQALRLLVEQLGENDRVAIVVYAGSSGLALASTSGLDKVAILEAIDRLEAGGSTHGSEGIVLAYETAVANLVPGGVNRVILATDGDFNVGVTDAGDLEALIADRARTGVFLTVLGFGMGNLKDETLERLADRGNGNYGYVDTIAEARKLFVEEIGGTLVTVAKDVKLQVEFNPERVAGYRLLGYENRLLSAADFNDDTKDAGDVGAGHRVTALYEIVLAGLPVPTALPSPTAPPTPIETATPTSIPGADATASPTPDIDPLRYAGDPAVAGELVTVKLRYKLPEATASTRTVFTLTETFAPYGSASESMRFAAAVAAFGMLLRGSPHAGDAEYADVREWAAGALGSDPSGYRAGFLDLLDRAAALGAGG